MADDEYDAIYGADGVDPDDPAAQRPHFRNLIQFLERPEGGNGRMSYNPLRLCDLVDEALQERRTDFFEKILKQFGWDAEEHGESARGTRPAAERALRSNETAFVRQRRTYA